MDNEKINEIKDTLSEYDELCKKKFELDNIFRMFREEAITIEQFIEQLKRYGIEIPDDLNSKRV